MIIFRPSRISVALALALAFGLAATPLARAQDAGETSDLVDLAAIARAAQAKQQPAAQAQAQNGQRRPALNPTESRVLEKAAGRAAAAAIKKADSKSYRTMGQAAAKAYADSQGARQADIARRLAAAYGEAGAETGKQDEMDRSLQGNPTVILFASSSLPLPVLRAYAAQLEKIGGVMVFRGAPGGLAKLAPMVTLTRSILVREEGCSDANCPLFGAGLIIDPLLFRSNGVTRVPALGLVRRDVFAAHCEDPDQALAVSKHVIYGDAALSGLLEAYGSLGGTETRMEVRDALKQLAP